MQHTSHTNLQIFIYTVLYTFQADLVDEFCAHIDLKWSCEQYDLLPRLFNSQKVVVAWGQEGKKSSITGQLRSYKYVRNKGKTNCGILLAKASRPLWSTD